jgi:hypothetical protein
MANEYKPIICTALMLLVGAPSTLTFALDNNAMAKEHLQKTLRELAARAWA